MQLEKEKLVRQLSLVAFLMSMHRPVTARDVRECVEGYSHMGDDAFARRFYADRTELIGLGVPLRSTRDDDTGEELYTLSARQYLLPTLDLTDHEVTALHACLSLLDGQFAYAEPLRLALQNLTLGRENPATDPALAATEVRLSGSDYSPEIAARIAKLETAITKRRTITFNYYTMGRSEESERVVDPYTLVWNNGQWYLVGWSHERQAERQFRLSRIRGEIKFTSRRERDFEVPSQFDASVYRTRPTWQFDEPTGEAELWVDPSAAWLVERSLQHSGEVAERHDDGSITIRTSYADMSWLTSWVLSMNGLVRPTSPVALVTQVEDALAIIVEQHEGAVPKLAPELPKLDIEEVPARRRKPAAPVGAEQFALLQTLMSDLLASCNTKGEGQVPVADLVQRYGIDDRKLREAVDLLTLVNFGAGAYAMYAEIDGDMVKVDAWPDGEVFRRPARLSPLEAKALMLALDLVGPLVAATASSDLASVRTKLTEAFGGYGNPTVPATAPTDSETYVLERLTTAMRERRTLTIEYWSQARGDVSKRTVEPVLLQRLKQHWYAVAYCRTADALRSFRLDRIKSLEVDDEVFTDRGLDLAGYQADTPTTTGTLEDSPRAVDLWFSADAAGYEIENRNAAQLADGSAIWHTATNGDSWLIEEILTYRGRAVVTAPADLRRRVAERARELRSVMHLVPVA
ncbi:MAG: transcriptional regulator protein-like protein [Thermoleophilia bacterium]|nr:transcriptional regulator protein-like protein [Thermoleophilia bacterium]